MLYKFSDSITIDSSTYSNFDSFWKDLPKKDEYNCEDYIIMFDKDTELSDLIPVSYDTYKKDLSWIFDIDYNLSSYSSYEQYIFIIEREYLGYDFNGLTYDMIDPVLNDFIGEFEDKFEFARTYFLDYENIPEEIYNKIACWINISNMLEGVMIIKDKFYFNLYLIQ